MFETTFKGTIKAIKPDNYAAFGISEASLISSAKLLLPEDYDPNDDFDILPVVFDLAVVNKFNANGDGISASEAQKIVKKFKNRPFNIEHKKDKIVGHIISASLSKKEHDFFDNSQEDFSSIEDPLYLNCAAYIYRHVFGDLANSIEEASDPESEDYMSISTSWEIGFKSYNIAVGSENIKDCAIITDKKEIMKLKKELKSQGGKGLTKEGLPVNRLIVGDIYPLGAALTMNPAANVRGVFPIYPVIEDDVKEQDVEEQEDNTTNSCNVYDKNHKSISTTSNFNVDIKRTKDLFMEKEQFEQFMQALEKLASTKMETSNASVSDFREVIKEALFDQTKSWESDLSKEKVARETAEANLTQVNQELATLKASVEAREAAETFNSRMSWIEDKFSFSDDELKVLVAEVKDIKSNDGFESYQGKLSTLFAHKLKDAVAAQEQEIANKVNEAVAAKLKEIEVSQASTSDAPKANDTKDKELKVEANANQDIPNNNQASTAAQSLLERVKSTFEVKIN
jgi:chemotaxis protein histidine kinase CheA